MVRIDLRRGALSMVVSGLLFAGMGASIKIASGRLPNTVVVTPSTRNVWTVGFFLLLLIMYVRLAHWLFSGRRPVPGGA